jgi:hypothetical protein
LLFVFKTTLIKLSDLFAFEILREPNIKGGKGLSRYRLAEFPGMFSTNYNFKVDKYRSLSLISRVMVTFISFEREGSFGFSHISLIADYFGNKAIMMFFSKEHFNLKKMQNSSSYLILAVGNNSVGQLGVGSTDANVKIWKQVPISLLPNEGIISLSQGWEHTICLTSNH